MIAAQMRTVDVQGWPVAFLAGDDEPRVRDIDLAERLGYERPRKIRDLIERMVVARKLSNIHQCPTVGRWPGQIAAVPITEYFLTESQALKVAAKSETEPADALLDEMIAVYVAARRGGAGAHELHLTLLRQSQGALARGDTTTARVLVHALDGLLSSQDGPPAPRGAVEVPALPEAAPRCLPGRPRGSRKNVVAMSPEEFRAARDAMGTNAVMCRVTGRAAPTVALYLNGRGRRPPPRRRPRPCPPGDVGRGQRRGCMSSPVNPVPLCEPEFFLIGGDRVDRTVRNPIPSYQEEL